MYNHLAMRKQVIYVELKVLVSHGNTWNNLTVCNRMNSGSLKEIS